MEKQVRAIILEDAQEEADLLVWELSSRGFAVQSRRVETAAGLRAALQEEQWDVILSGGELAQLSPVAAVDVLRQLRLDLPLLLVLDAVNAEVVAQALEAGACDVVSKDRLSRLGPALEHALLEAGLRRERKRSEEIEAERKRLETQFLHAQRLESIGTLASGIAHDLNNVLSPIVMAGQMLRMRGLDPESEHLLSMIEANAQRGAEIVAQMLRFSRRVEGKRTWVKPGRLIADMVELVSRTFPKAIAVNSSTAEELWQVSGDATQLHQVLLNLCLNARDAMPDGGTLTLAGRNLSLDQSYASMAPGAKPGAYVLLEVLDTGVGIPPEVMQKIFDPFFTTKGEGEGAGLGLSSVLGIVKNHGGFVEVRSARGRGTAFRVFLPAQVDQPKADRLQERPAPPRGAGELILLADDSADIREVTQQSLSGHGYRVLVAADGVEGLVLFARHLGEIQLLMTDVEMPIMDGLALIRAARKMNPQVRVLVAGGNLEQARTAVELQALKVHSILAKPFTTEELLAAVSSALGKY